MALATGMEIPNDSKRLPPELAGDYAEKQAGLITARELAQRIMSYVDRTPASPPIPTGHAQTVRGGIRVLGKRLVAKSQ